MGHFGPIGRFRLQPSILLTLKRDISRPKCIAGKRSAVDFIVLNACTSHDADDKANDKKGQGKIAIHEHLVLV